MRYVLSLTIAALVFGVSQTATACSCAPPPGPKKALATASAVFLGKVVEIKRGGGMFGPVQVTFEVKTNYKAVKGKKVTVRTASSGSLCGYGFKKGGSYLVYCYGKPEALSTNICTRTRAAAAAKEDLAALGDGLAIAK
jgi:hypothetical protein